MTIKGVGIEIQIFLTARDFKKKLYECIFVAALFLGAEMKSHFAKEWDKKNNCKDALYSIKLVA